MKDGKGYILPEEPQTEGLRCLKVWIPDDDRYLEAFSAQFHDLATWLLWQKDGTNRASLAAATWKDAIDYTYENGWLNCGDDMDCCPEILERLDNIESLIQNQTCTCDCHQSTQGGGNNAMCCCCGCGNNTNEPPFNPDETTEPPTPPSPEEIPSSDEWRCDSSNQAVDNWAQYWQNIETGVTVGGFLQTILAAAGGFTSFLVTSTIWILAMVAALSAVAVAPLANVVKQWFQYHYENLVCLLVSASTPANAYNLYITFVNDHYAEPNSGAFNSLVKYLLLRTGEMSDWNKLFIEDSFTIDSNNVGSDCSSCSEAPPPPEPLPVPLPPPEILEGLQFMDLRRGTNLTTGYPIAPGEQVYMYVLYHVRSTYRSGSTSDDDQINLRFLIPDGSEFEWDDYGFVFHDMPGAAGIVPDTNNPPPEVLAIYVEEGVVYTNPVGQFPLAIVPHPTALVHREEPQSGGFDWFFYITTAEEAIVIGEEG